MTPGESRVHDYHKRLYSKGLAKIHKVPTSLNVEKWLGNGKALCNSGRPSLVDFVGYLQVAAGIYAARSYICIEEKTCNEKQASLLRSDFKDHQISYLIEAHQDGCLSFTVVYSKRMDAAYAVSSELLTELPLKWTDLEPLRLKGVEWFPQVGVTL
jgi:penicillin-binding protein-related factor A (putative recombinase)